MAIGWLTALKLVPWADVIEAAPGLAKSARGLFKRTQEAAPATAEAAPPKTASAHGGDGDASALALVQATQRVAALDALLAQAIERQQAAADLLDKLASQNARMVEAIDALGRGYRSLKTWLIVVSVAAVAALVWVASIER